MIQLVIGAAAGYVLGTKAGRRRFEQIRGGYEAVINSPVTRKAVTAGRKALADRLDPDPRMREVRDLNKGSRSSLTSSDALLEDDLVDFEEDRVTDSDKRVMQDAKGRPVQDQDGRGRRR
ncbi:hypothetical protein [Corynebacterium terpenotabidum]|uniref:Uncharacterized protein n=1 Tax=Corynebacterium terpenotabidum Y-11 TaxID=1200352 RepID=S4XDA3_9CORY|nr:hypothetical protein [Corynebacterium terpenotabidum]AGP30494.1 hypothetical protein A606_04225 [Corynebacterium terpenotabidum Y-11]